MFSNKRPSYPKLRTNLRLSINRLKLLQKKKTELALKARADIAEYIKNGKDDRARIRVEHIVREDYLVEAMEIIEMYCDLLLSRFGLMEKMKEMDGGLEKPIATLIWASPRLYADVPEMKEIANQFTIKYGKEYAEACRSNKLEMVDDKVIHKMVIIAPPKKLIENYLVEIAKTYNVPFEPDPMALEEPMPIENLLDIGFDSVDPKKPGGGGGAGGGGGGGGLGGGMIPLLPEHMNPPPPMAPGPYQYPGQPPIMAAPAGAYIPPQAGMMFQPMGPPNPPQYSEGHPPVAGYQPPPIPSLPPNAAGSKPDGGSESLSTVSPGSEKPADSLGQDFSANVLPTLPPAGPAGHQMPPTGQQGYQMPPTGQQGYYMPPSGQQGYQGPPVLPAVPPAGPNEEVVKPPHYDDVFGPGNQVSGANPAGSVPSQPYSPLGGVPSQPSGPPGGASSGGAPVGDFPQLPSVPANLEFPGLPSVPTDSVATNGDDINFDDLTKRFEDLKKKK